MIRLVAIVGPTAVGKSKLALQLAQIFGGEIINADSRQIYLKMDIGTAKPGANEKKLIPHHLLDIVRPDQPYSLAVYKESVYRIIDEVNSRGNLPFLVGGTGQYIWAVLENWMVPDVKPDYDYRLLLENKAKEEGPAVLFEELKKLDPESARRIMPTNVRRVIRALEIAKYTGKPASRLRQKASPPFNFIIIGLTMERKLLYQKIDFRVDHMINSGLVDEVKGLIDKGYYTDLPSMSSIGYRQIAAFIEKKLSLEEASRQIKFETHRFARKQYAWFHISDKRIHWFDVNSDIEDNIKKLISEFCAGTSKPTEK
jgi:tRNA dimethylallyltransferase